MNININSSSSMSASDNSSISNNSVRISTNNTAPGSFARPELHVLHKVTMPGSLLASSESERSFFSNDSSKLSKLSKQNQHLSFATKKQAYNNHASPPNLKNATFSNEVPSDDDGSEKAVAKVTPATSASSMATSTSNTAPSKKGHKRKKRKQEKGSRSKKRKHSTANSDDDDSIMSGLPPKPKRPMTAYNFFFRDQCNKIKNMGLDNYNNMMDGKPYRQESDPTKVHKIPFEEMGKAIGRRWREIAKDELARYQKLAAAESLRYKREMSHYANKAMELWEQKGKIVSTRGEAVQVQQQPAQPTQQQPTLTLTPTQLNMLINAQLLAQQQQQIAQARQQPLLQQGQAGLQAQLSSMSAAASVAAAQPPPPSPAPTTTVTAITSEELKIITSQQEQINQLQAQLNQLQQQARTGNTGSSPSSSLTNSFNSNNIGNTNNNNATACLSTSNHSSVTNGTTRAVTKIPTTSIETHPHSDNSAVESDVSSSSSDLSSNSRRLHQLQNQLQAQFNVLQAQQNSLHPLPSNASSLLPHPIGNANTFAPINNNGAANYGQTSHQATAIPPAVQQQPTQRPQLNKKISSLSSNSANGGGSDDSGLLQSLAQAAFGNNGGDGWGSIRSL